MTTKNYICINIYIYIYEKIMLKNINTLIRKKNINTFELLEIEKLKK